MKTLRIVQIVAWSAVAVMLIGLLVFFLTHGGNGFDFAFDLSHPAGAQVLEKAAETADIQTVEVDVKNADVIYKTGGEDIRVVCYGDSKRDAEAFSAVQSGGTLRVSQAWRMFDWNWLSWGSRRVEVTLPAGWHGNLALTSASGDVSLTGEMALSEANLSLTSGDVRLDSALTAQSFRIASVSGDIRLGSVDCKSFDIHSTSGDIRLESLAGAGEVRTTSGTISLGSLVRMDGSVKLSTVSGDVQLALAQSVGADVDAHCLSGDISSTYPLSYSGSRRNDASGKIGTAPYSSLMLSTTSGDIRIK